MAFHEIYHGRSSARDMEQEAIDWILGAIVIRTGNF